MMIDKVHGGTTVENSSLERLVANDLNHML